jgi:hypothetical protein
LFADFVVIFWRYIANNIVMEIKETLWKLFEETGEIGYYNLYIALGVKK